MYTQLTETKMAKGNVLPGKLLVKRDEIEEKTASGVILPTNLLEPPTRGTVMLTGQAQAGKHAQEMVVQVGDKVFYSDRAGTPVILDEPDLSLRGEYVLLDQSHVLFYKKEK